MNLLRSTTVQFVVVAGVLILVLAGELAGGFIGASVGLLVGLLVGVAPWRGQSLWSWCGLYLRRRRPIELHEPVTVANDRTGGGVRYQDGVAAVAVHVLGKSHTPTIFTGAASIYAENTLDVTELYGLLRQSLGLSVESLSVISVGARRRSNGDFARVYDTMIGPPPYAGLRETWLIVRIDAFANADALKSRITVGTGAIAAAQRVSAALRERGVRARVTTSTEIVELERRVGQVALEPARRQWGSLRGDQGWLTTYAYRPSDITADVLGQAWSMPADGIVGNITLFSDRTATATVTVRTAQPLPAPPSVLLHALPGEQATALAANLCGPRPELRGARRGVLPAGLTIPVGPSGVLLGRMGAGDRLMLPFGDPGEFTRVHVAADDHLTKRIIIRAAAAGERITIHSKNVHRWSSVRPADVVVTDRARPAPGTTVSVVDGPVSPVPRPQTLISVGRRGEPHRGHADMVIAQTGPATVEVTVGDRVFDVEVELFRAENRYVSSESISMMSTTEFAEGSG